VDEENMSASWHPLTSIRRWRALYQAEQRAQLEARIQSHLDEAIAHMISIRPFLRSRLKDDLLRTNDEQRRYLQAYLFSPQTTCMYALLEAKLPSIMTITFTNSDDNDSLQPGATTSAQQAPYTTQANLAWDTRTHEPVALILEQPTTDQSDEQSRRRALQETPPAPYRFLFFTREQPTPTELRRAQQQLGLQWYTAVQPHPRSLFFELTTRYENDWHRFNYLGTIDERHIYGNNEQLDSSKNPHRGWGGIAI
jgi:hypothetical protein